PVGARVRVPADTPVSRVLFSESVHVETPCGGAGKCGKCRIIAKGGLSPLSESEKAHLTADELQAGFRLACCAAITGDCEIFIPEESHAGVQQILTETAPVECGVKPRLVKTFCSLREPGLGEVTSEAEPVLRACGASRISRRLLGSLAPALRAAAYSFTAVVLDDTLIAVEPGDTSACCLGAAFDIGSTTLAGYLADLRTGRVLAADSMMNPQILFGDDLISRINYIGRDPAALEQLRQPLMASLSRMAENMARKAGADKDSIYYAVFAGNTCMCHIAAGILPFTLGVSPYIPTTTEALLLPADEAGLEINPAGLIQFLPCIGGFVGADTTGVVLSSLPLDDKTRMAVDIGTNGEIALWHKGSLSVCSAAAGPAFEGAGISCGMRGGAGAIDKVYMEGGAFKARVCGGEKAKGICGSGLVDAVRVLLEEGAIDMTGRLLPPEEFSGSPAIAERLTAGEKGAEFILAFPEESRSGYPIALRHSDIRALQLAKGSICAAIRTLLDENGITEYDLESLALAGGFGNYLDKHSAIAIGLLPQIDPDRIIPAGNGAGTGAIEALISADMLARAGEIAAGARHYELALSARYQMNLMDAMMFYQENKI
ncbi:MAG: DUF4445 domain-containing protein, partial [Abditibacteriota bacterium]|nr:DUF4445 domain-containing protein [Abditibacteriota bacterium]